MIEDIFKIELFPVDKNEINSIRDIVNTVKLKMNSVHEFAIS